VTTSEIGARLQIRDLRVAYQRDIEVLRGVNVAAAPGKITVIIGPNGAGKSTLLRSIFGLAPIVGGWVSLDGSDITGAPAPQLLTRRVAFVPQERSIFPDMTVAENLQLGGWIRRNDRHWLRDRIEAVCTEFPVLQHRLREPAGNISGGQQKLLEIARGLMIEPAVLVLDEPTAGLAPGMAKQVYKEIANLNRRLNVTILLVDQNVREALALGDYVYVLEMGRNQVEGNTSAVFDRLDEIVRGWMGISASGVHDEHLAP
jgi:branched-chain amino acid transport system ATP-binding protein